MSKTREILIEVARQLFARVGVENTTMNDIANASPKGRRTLYTYFKNKQEVYHAVIEHELSILTDTLVRLSKSTLPADEKLIAYIFARFEAIKTIVLRNGTLKAEFFRNIWLVESVRKNIDHDEIMCIKNILDEGVEQRVFQVTDSTITASMLYYALKGLDVPYIRGSFADVGIARSSLKQQITDFVLSGLRQQTSPSIANETSITNN